MPVFLGVDGGQSTTEAVLADERADILAQATGGPSDNESDLLLERLGEAGAHSSVQQDRSRHNEF